jgi:hypothetical protein
MMVSIQYNPDIDYYQWFYPVIAWNAVLRSIGGPWNRRYLPTPVSVLPPKSFQESTNTRANTKKTT